ncbi:MAG: FHA domain-containing protein [Phycisphaerae bacterium]|nr:FHA domain-containing protein [Phycisphaerae bacterium]
MDVNLVILKRHEPKKAIPVTQPMVVIGRRKFCDLRIPVANVSRKHCRLHHEDGIFKITDLGSKNGTFVNGKPIKNDAPLNAGDVLKVGPVRLMLQIDGKPEKLSRPANVHAKKKEKKSAPSPDDNFINFTDLCLDEA